MIRRPILDKVSDALISKQVMYKSHVFKVYPCLHNRLPVNIYQKKLILTSAMPI